MPTRIGPAPVLQPVNCQDWGFSYFSTSLPTSLSPVGKLSATKFENEAVCNSFGPSPTNTICAYDRVLSFLHACQGLRLGLTKESNVAVDVIVFTSVRSFITETRPSSLRPLVSLDSLAAPRHHAELDTTGLREASAFSESIQRP